MKSSDKIVAFIRKRDYIFVKELGQGACGKTILLRDDTIRKQFVCKKYSPHAEEHRQELFGNFLREITLLHELHHHNVVRVFNYYLYPEQLTGYILMEYVDGADIEDYLAASPERVNETFLQALEGFRYMETQNVLHRDIRPQNILIRDDGALKIIDLGFGKRIEGLNDFDKSISLNWWCEPPAEFTRSIYDFRSEVYFLGKLFEKIIQDHDIQHFKYQNLLGRMCRWNPEERLPSFFDAQKEIKSNQFSEIAFTDEEEVAYREFSNRLSLHLSKIESGTKYVDDPERIRTALESVYRNCMIEDAVPDAALVLRCFINGGYYYQKTGFPTSALRDFIGLLRSCTLEKQRIAIANLHTRIDAIQRYTAPPFDDDIPF